MKQHELIGRTIGGRYELTSLLGEGGSSVVFRARAVESDDRFAVKMLLVGSDRQAMARLIREMQALSRLKHPNIVRTVDLGQGPGNSLFLVMEYLEGRSLHSLMGDGPLSPAFTLTIVSQVADALRAAHEHEVIHRDLKPENILLVDEGQGVQTAKMLDFGIAKVLDAPSLTNTGVIVGTPGYIAPETIIGNVVDGRADIYSLGVLMYEMLTGYLPYNAWSSHELVVQAYVDDPIPMRRRDPAIHPEVEAFVMRCLAKEAKDRWYSAEAVLVELARLKEVVGAG